MRLKLTTPFPPAGRRAGCLPVLDARSCALEYRRPHAFRAPSGALHARESVSTAPAGRGRASVCASPDLTHFPAPAAWGRGLRPHLEPPRLGATTATATVYDLPAISRRLPRQCADPVGRVRLTGLRLDAWPRCATALRSAAERPPTPPPGLRQVAARLRLARTAAPCRQPAADSPGQGGHWPPAGLSPSPACHHRFSCAVAVPASLPQSSPCGSSPGGHFVRSCSRFLSDCGFGSA